MVAFVGSCLLRLLTQLPHMCMCIEVHRFAIALTFEA